VPQPHETRPSLPKPSPTSTQRQAGNVLHHQVSASEETGLGQAGREVVVSVLAFAVQHERIYLRAFVVMPDHWHALFALCEPWTLPRFMHHMMSYVGGRTTALLETHKTSW
jgi:Transposase IS200 like